MRMRVMGSCTRRREASMWPSVSEPLPAVVKQQCERQGGPGSLISARRSRKQRSEGSVVVRRPPEVLQRDQGVLVHGVAMEEVADHQALDLGEFGEDGGEHAGLVHGAHGGGACGSASNWLSTGHSG